MPFPYTFPFYFEDKAKKMAPTATLVAERRSTTLIAIPRGVVLVAVPRPKNDASGD